MKDMYGYRRRIVTDTGYSLELIYGNTSRMVRDYIESTNMESKGRQMKLQSSE